WPSRTIEVPRDAADTTEPIAPPAHPRSAVPARLHAITARACGPSPLAHGRGHGGDGFGPTPFHAAAHCWAMSSATRSVPSARVIAPSHRPPNLSGFTDVTVTLDPFVNSSAR